MKTRLKGGVLKSVDYIIIGQGLAGSCLALQLLNLKKKIMVLDQPHANRASVIAAGLFNPITGKVMMKTWRAAELFTYLHSFYLEAQALLNAEFFFPRPLYRPFISAEEQNEWMGKSADGGLGDFIEAVYSAPAFTEDVMNPYGGVLLKGCGYVHTETFLKAVRRQLIDLDSYKETAFDEKALEVGGSQMVYQNWSAPKIIYCNGVAAQQSKYFKEVPLRALKGETLTIAVQPFLPRVYNRGVYVVPSAAPDQYKVGATYHAHDFTEAITLKAKQELSDKLDELLLRPRQLLSQQWGMRPTVSDRRPVIGPSRHNSKIILFNGLGTKGVSLAPFFSARLALWLEGKGLIEPTVAIERFY
jgi:glycine/D-amino acid oxidase-like deaminating enzyme